MREAVECRNGFTRATPYKGWCRDRRWPTLVCVKWPFPERPAVRGAREARLQETSVDTQRRMDEERMRLDGLRVLARIIARHALAHPHLYLDQRDGDPAAAPAAGGSATATEPAGKDDAA